MPGAVQPFFDLPEVQATNAGRYSFTVTNAAGGAASAPAWLRVRTLGEVIAWGDDRDGQVTLPPALLSAHDVLHLAGGGEHSLALRGDGSEIGRAHV